MIVRMIVALNRTVNDSDWRFDNLWRSHLQSQNKLNTINIRDTIHFDSKDDYRTLVQTSFTVINTTLTWTILFYLLILCGQFSRLRQLERRHTQPHYNNHEIKTPVLWMRLHPSEDRWIESTLINSSHCKKHVLPVQWSFLMCWNFSHCGYWYRHLQHCGSKILCLFS